VSVDFQNNARRTAAGPVASITVRRVNPRYRNTGEVDFDIEIMTNELVVVAVIDFEGGSVPLDQGETLTVPTHARITWSDA
jgi:hypothetical protein